MESRITVYVPRTQLTEVVGGIKPAEFWLSKPTSWHKDDIIEVQISMSVYAEWTKGNISSKQLLKG